MAVESWFDGWLLRHLERHPRPDWPDPAAERAFYDGWRSSFKRHGVREAEADEASLRLVDDPPPYLSGHAPSLVALCRAVCREHAEAGPAAALASREAAARASLDCDDCGGTTGLTLRHRRLSAGSLDDRGHRRPDGVVFYCRCPLGRFVERAHREGDESAREVRRRIPDLADHPWLWGDEHRRPAGVSSPAPGQGAPRRKGYPWATGRPEPNVADPAPAATARPEAGPEPYGDGPAF